MDDDCRDELSPLVDAQLRDGWNCAPKRRLFLAEFATPVAGRKREAAGKAKRRGRKVRS